MAALEVRRPLDTKREVRVILNAPTASPYIYNLASMTTDVTRNYEARMSVSQHFQLMVDCNEDNQTTQQCQLTCRRNHIHSKCKHCRATTLGSQLLGWSY